jgi:N-acetylglucosaminyl-diphospho-decaprenol L-rhamnosyltransferase
VVSHERVALLRRCLESLEASEGRETLQVIVVDNASRDGSASLDSDFPNVQFIRLPRNFGLTKAMNIGWRAASAEYVLFLHEDAALEPRVAALLAGALDAHPEASAACPLLVDEEGRPAPQLCGFPPGGAYEPAECTDEEPAAIDCPLGAALMIRAIAIKAIRQIDERYGQFGADADLAAQIRRAGKKILLLPSARARHEGGRPESAALEADRLLGRAVFIGKYYGAWPGAKARIAAALGPLARFRLAVFQAASAGQKIDGSQA